MARFGDRGERERYMDSLERQMERQREQIERTLDRTMEDSDRRTALEKFWGSLPGFPGRTRVQGAGPTETPTPAPGNAQEATESPQTRPEEQPRPRWRKLMGR